MTTTLIVDSNVPGANVIKDGIIAGQVGQSLEADPPETVIEVSKKGYISRKVTVETPRGRSSRIHVTLLKENARSKKFGAYRSDGKSFTPVGKSKSFCQMYNALAGACSSVSILGDIELGGGFSFEGLKSKIDSSRETRLISTNPKDLVKKNWLYRAEHLLAARPTDRFLLSLVAYANMLQNNCARSLEISHEAFLYGAIDSRLLAIRAFCHELRGDLKGASRIMESAYKKTSNKAFHFYSVRSSVLAGQPGVRKKIEACAFRKGINLSCYLLGRSYFHAMGNEVGFSRLARRLRENVSQDAEGFATDILRLEKEGKSTLIGGVLDNLSREQDPTLAFMLIAGIARDSQGVKRMRIKGVKLGRRKVVDRLLELLEKHGKKDLHLKGMEEMVRRFPTRPYYAWKLATKYYESNNCNGAIDVMQDADFEAPKYKKGYLDIAGRCHWKLKRYDAALEVYSELKDLTPSDWLPSYWLGNIYGKLGNEKKAKKMYKEALGLNPPSKFKSTISKKINQLR